MSTATAPSSAPADAALFAMLKATWAKHAAGLATWSMARCVNRTDVWGGYLPVQYREGKPSPATTKPKKADRLKVFLTQETLAKHFTGARESAVVGLHSTSAEGLCKWGAIEVDRHGDDDGQPSPDALFSFALSVFDSLKGIGFRPLLTDSNGRGGLHLRIFFEQPVMSALVYRFLRQLAAGYGDFGLTTAPETFPKQPELSKKAEFGNWLRLPGRHHTRKHLSQVWDGEKWLAGEPAIKFILAIEGDSADLVPFIPPADDEKATPRHEGNGHGRASHEPPTDKVLERARKYLAAIPPAIEGNGGDNHTFYVACRLVHGFDLRQAEARPVFEEWNRTCCPPWDDERLQRNLERADAEPGPRGFLLSSGTDESAADEICNFRLIPGEEGKAESVPKTMAETLADFQGITGDWPRRVGAALFVDQGNDEISWLDDPSALFGWATNKHGLARWTSGANVGYVSKAEFFAALRMTATRYECVETLPHFPPVENHYYACSTPTPGDGSTLNELLEMFAYASPLDRDLMEAAIVTPGWGGPPGCRPVFVLTSQEGRGTGKSKTCSMFGRVWGGTLDFSHREDISVIKQRLLSPGAMTQRMALLDNVKTLKFSWAELEALVTASVISGKQMYEGEASRPNLLTWFVTLNGVSLAKDMAQRSVIIEIKRPTYSDDWEEDVGRFIDTNRPAILADVAEFFAKEPIQLSKFTRWGTWEKGVLSRLGDPSEAQRLIAERQYAVDVEDEEGGIVEDFFAKQLAMLGYKVATDKIFIPSGIAARWLNWATGEKYTVIAASRLLNQAAVEGQLKRITKNTHNGDSRGFVWATAEAMTGNPFIDLEERITKKARDAANKNGDGVNKADQGG